MNEQNFFGAKFLGKCDQRFARGVRAKLKLLDVATHTLRRSSGSSVTCSSGRAFRRIPAGDSGSA